MRNFINMITNPEAAVLTEGHRHLTPDLKKQRDKVAKALAREHPDWAQPRVYAIATTAAEKTVKEEVAECDLDEDLSPDHIIASGIAMTAGQYVGRRVVQGVKKLVAKKKSEKNMTEGKGVEEFTKTIKCDDKAFVFEITKVARAHYVWKLVSVDGDESHHGANNVDMRIGNFADAVDECRRFAKSFKATKISHISEAKRKSMIVPKQDKKTHQHKCVACNGSGHYDTKGSPKCSACDGTGMIEESLSESILSTMRLHVQEALGTAFGTAGMATKVGDDDEVKLSVFVNQDDIPAVSKIFHDQYINPEIHNPVSAKISKFRVTGECTRAEGNLIMRAIKMAGIDAASRLL